MGCAAPALAWAADAPTRRPNIVVILGDDLGYADIGAFGSEINTPNIDALARDGVRFTNFYCSDSPCLPSRTALFTGMVMALRMVASGLVEGPVLISITKLLHGVELPVLLVSIFKYNSAHFDKRLSSTLYLVGFACTSSVIATVLSPL